MLFNSIIQIIFEIVFMLNYYPETHFKNER
jgi:hypothetical protein